MTNHVDHGDAMENRLVRALEATPAVSIPEGFAARVAAKAPAGAMAVRRAVPMTTQVGVRMAWAVAAVLLVAMFVLAPSAAGMGTLRWVEYSVEMEFVALTVWLTLRPLLRRR
jgi:hypothetical protein